MLPTLLPGQDKSASSGPMSDAFKFVVSYGVSLPPRGSSNKSLVLGSVTLSAN